MSFNGFPSLLASLPLSQAQGAGVGGDASLVLPDLALGGLFVGLSARTLLLAGIAVCIGGFLFGLSIYTKLRALPVHAAMREVSELIYETCKTYLWKQGKFILIL